MLSSKIWMSEKSFKVLKDEELPVPINKNREGHTAQSLSFNLCPKFKLVCLIAYFIFFFPPWHSYLFTMNLKKKNIFLFFLASCIYFPACLQEWHIENFVLFKDTLSCFCRILQKFLTFCPTEVFCRVISYLVSAVPANNASFSVVDFLLVNSSGCDTFPQSQVSWSHKHFIISFILSWLCISTPVIFMIPGS